MKILSNPFAALSSEESVFRWAIGRVNKARADGFPFTGKFVEPDYNPRHSDSQYDRPRLFAGKLANCYRMIFYLLTDPTEFEMDEGAYENFERGVIYERAMALFLEILESEIDEESPIMALGTQTTFGGEQLTPDGISISGRGDAWILWRRHPSTGSPALEILDFKSKGDFGYKKVIGGEAVRTDHVLQTAAGALFLGRFDDESEPRQAARANGLDPDAIDVTWRVVTVAHSIAGWGSKHHDESSRSTMEYGSVLIEGGTDWDDEESQTHVMKMLVSDAGAQSKVWARAKAYREGETVNIPRRYHPFTRMTTGDEITKWTSDGKGVWERKLGDQDVFSSEAAEEWSCKYCNYRGRCPEESGAVSISTKGTTDE